MVFIKWDEKFVSGHKTIDEQHQKLISMIENFYQNIKMGAKQEILKELLTGLYDYTKFHFKTEEDLMDNNFYTLTKKHKQEHDEFKNKVNDWMDRINNGKLLISLEVTNFLRDWIENHILQSDLHMLKEITDRKV